MLCLDKFSYLLCFDKFWCTTCRYVCCMYYICIMYVCMVTHIARVAWINRVRLPILHVVSYTRKMNIFLSAFAPENLVWRNGFGSTVPRQPANLHTQTGSCAYLRDSSRVPRRRPFYLFKTAIRHRVSPEFVESRNCVPTAFTAERPPAQGQ